MPHSVFGPEVERVFAAARTASQRAVKVDGRDVPITCPFASPEDWRDRWIYFALVDRFNNADKPPAKTWDQPYGRFQGGTIQGVQDRLGYLQRLGVGAIWLSPVLQNCQAQEGTYHGYGIQHFLQVDPRFAPGNDPDGTLRAFVDEAHARGMHVIMDIVLNHAGDVFAYRNPDGTMADALPWRDQEYDIRWRGADNDPVADWSEAPQEGASGLTPNAAVWPDELRSNRAFRRKGKGGEAGGDFESLREFVSAEPDIRAALIRCYQHAIAKWDIDGFRIDTLKYIEPDFALVFGNAMREYALEIGKRNFFTFGEVYDNEQKIAEFIGRNVTKSGDLVGVDAALDFPLFFRLPWVAKGLAPPTDIAGIYDLRKSVEQDVISSHGEASRFFVTFLDNHDQTSRLRYVDPADPGRYDGQVFLALACLFGLQGIPCIYYGTEQGLSGRGNMDQNVREALWGKPNAFDETSPFFVHLQQIARVRTANPALRFGRQYMRPVSGDRRTFGMSSFAPGVLAFSRILNESETVVVANTSLDAGCELSVLVDAVLNAEGTQFTTLYSSTGQTGSGTVERLNGVAIGGDPSATVHAIRISLAPGEARILARQPH